MRILGRCGIVLLLALAVVPGWATAGTQQEIGSWVLSCPGNKPGSEPCLMRLDRRFPD
jgi:hypothetical protein